MIILQPTDVEVPEAHLSQLSWHYATYPAAAYIHLTPRHSYTIAGLPPTRYVSPHIPSSALCTNAAWQAKDNQIILDNHAAGC